MRPRAAATAFAAATLLAVVITPMTTAHAADPPAHGLRGDYYTGQFESLKATVVDPQLDFGDLEPTLAGLTGQNDHDTVRWTGRIQPPSSDTYTFSIVGDNGFRLWVDDQLVIDHWVDDWDNPQTGTPITLDAGRLHDLKVEYFEDVGGSNLHLSWSTATLPKQAVPTSALFLPADFHYQGPLTSTVAADGRTATLTFEQAVSATATTASHLHLTLNGTPDAVTSVSAAGQRLRLRLADPVPKQAGNTVRAVYDGQGGLTTADGTAVPAFNVFVDNLSTYQITTPFKADALPDYPRPQLTRADWQNLNGQWQYQAGTPDQQPPTGSLSGRIRVPYPPESLLSGVQRHDDVMWYRRTFTVPASWRQRVVLHFGAVDYTATVWVNGTQVATHTGGYTAFDVDITAALRGKGPQVLLVRAVDRTDAGPGNQPIGKQRTNPSGIWYTSSSGIWQTVWLEPVATAHVDRLDLVPDLATGTLTLTAVGQNLSGVRVEASAYDGSRKVGSVSGPAGAALVLPVPHAKLWSPDHPFLYDLKVRLVAGGRTVDQVGSYFGMRSVSIGDVNGQPHILLNGAFTFNLGTLDQGFWPDGLYTAPSDSALRFDLQVQKNLGFNTVRKHIKVEPDRWYYWADRLGLIVWQDMPAMDPGRSTSAADRTAFEAELHTVIDQHLSHPSITMWVPFNEGWAEYDPLRIADQVKAWDPSRLVNEDSGQNCCNSLPDPHGGDVYDNHNYPEPGRPSITDRRAIVDGEFGGLGLQVPGHMWFGSGFAYEMEPTSQALTDRYVGLDKQLEACIRCGLSGSIYTQPTDVEGEINGLMTYDRRVLKVKADQVRAANLAVLAAAGTVTSPPPPPPGTPGPIGVGAWPFDQVTGTTTPDVSGHGHDATLVNGPLPAGGHLQFNGVDQWVDTGSSILDTTGNYSVSALVSMDSPGNGFQTAVSQDSAGGSSEFFLQYSGQDHRFAFSAVGIRALAPTAPVAGQWYRLVGVRDAQRGLMLLYVDGQLAGSAAYCPGSAATGHTVIGRAQYQGNQVDYWAGGIDDVHVYDRALSPTEVATLP